MSQDVFCVYCTRSKIDSKTHLLQTEESHETGNRQKRLLAQVVQQLTNVAYLENIPAMKNQRLAYRTLYMRDTHKFFWRTPKINHPIQYMKQFAISLMIIFVFILEITEIVYAYINTYI